MSFRAQVVDDPAATAAERIAAVVRRGGGQIALAGGSTPRSAYERVAGMALDWASTTLWFGDERCVPPDHEHSNYAMAKAALLDSIEGPMPVVRRIEGELGPEAAAASYDDALRAAFGDEPAPALDLVLLGLGPDSHTASLFPGDAAVGERRRWAAAVETPGMAPLVSRVTLTLPVLNAARDVAFLIAGADKAPAVRRAFAGVAGPDAPASLVRPEPGSLTLILDAAAAEGLA